MDPAAGVAIAAATAEVHRMTGRLRLVAITRSEARLFIAKLHRHARPPAVCIFQVGVEADGELVGVAMGARPLARKLCDGETLEVSRVCTDGSRNAASMLYGAVCRAAAALGYKRVVTYTLESESGASLKASGFHADSEIRRHDPTGWSRQKTTRSAPVDLFGNRTTPDEPKRRWWRQVA